MLWSKIFMKPLNMNVVSFGKYIQFTAYSVEVLKREIIYWLN